MEQDLFQQLMALYDDEVQRISDNPEAGAELQTHCEVILEARKRMKFAWPEGGESQPLCEHLRGTPEVVELLRLSAPKG